MLFLRQSAGQMADRRPLRFWQPFNDWWRHELSQLGRRPNAAEIVTWYNENAVRLWGNEAPTIQDTRIHAKCLRSLGSVKDYFRQYRKKKRKGDRDVSTEPDVDYEEPEMHTRSSHRRYSTVSRSDTEQEQPIPDSVCVPAEQTNKELNLALDQPQWKLLNVYTMQSMQAQHPQPCGMPTWSPMPAPSAPLWDQHMLNLGTPGQKMHTAATEPIPLPVGMLQGEPMMQQHLLHEPLSMPQDYHVEQQQATRQQPVHMQLGEQMEHKLQILSPPMHMPKVEQIKQETSPQLVDHGQWQAPVQQQLFKNYLDLQAQHRAAQQQQQALAALAQQYTLTKATQVQSGASTADQQPLDGPLFVPFHSNRNNNISMPGSIASWDSQENSILQQHTSSHQSFDGQPIAKLLYQAPSYQMSDIRVPSYTSLCPSTYSSLDLSQPTTSQQQRNPKKRPAKEPSTDMLTYEPRNHVCFADDDSWNCVRKSVFEIQTKSTSPVEQHSWDTQQLNMQTESGSRDEHSHMQLCCQSQQQPSGLLSGPYPASALCNLMDQIRQFPGVPTIPDVQDPNKDKPDKALVKLYQQLNKFNQRIKQQDTCL